MQMALGALDTSQTKPWSLGKVDLAISLLRAELAKPEPEPVAWAIVSNSTGEYYGIDKTKEYCDHLVNDKNIDGFRNASVVPLYRKEDVL